MAAFWLSGISPDFLRFFSNSACQVWYKINEGRTAMRKNHTTSKTSNSVTDLVLVSENFRSTEAGTKEPIAAEIFLTKSPIAPPITSAPETKVLIVHHAPLVRSGLVALLGASNRFAVCAHTGDAPTARTMFVEHQPQLIILGLTLNHGNGTELIKDFRRMSVATRVLVLSAREDPLSIQRAFRAGAHGYLGIEDDPSETLQALERISAGDLYASANVTRRLLHSLASSEIEPAGSDVKPLSDRELQVFSLIGRGFGASRLATELHLSVKTIETYQKHIKEKLGLHSAAELSDKATRWMLDSMRRHRRLTNVLKPAGRVGSNLKN
jgi:DNA-binding NarL/FixJ family response regulator